MSMRMTLPQPGEHSEAPLHCELTEAKLPTLLNSLFGEDKWGKGFSGCGDGAGGTEIDFYFKTRCSFNVFKENNDE